ncbi:MAG: cytochrome b [Gemmatimonadales bacterium]|nr:MAG: cytochrome b [Gemmatimonadales bacterium]
MSPNPPTPRYHPVSRIFHWAVALGVAVMIPVGILMTSGSVEGIQDELYILHKGLGTILLVLVAARLAWRLFHSPPPMPESMPPGQRRTARFVHGTLYALLVVMTTSGYVRTVGDGFPIELLDALGLPYLLPEMPDVAAWMVLVHKGSAYLLAALVAAHVGAVVHAQLFAGHGVFRRMWPPVGGGGQKGEG